MIHWIWWKFGVRMSAATDVLSWVMQSLQFHVFINFSWHLASWPIDACRSHLHQYKYPQLLLIKSCFQRISGNWSGRLSQNNQRKEMGEKKKHGEIVVVIIWSKTWETEQKQHGHHAEASWCNTIKWQKNGGRTSSKRSNYNKIKRWSELVINSRFFFSPRGSSQWTTTVSQTLTSNCIYCPAPAR